MISAFIACLLFAVFIVVVRGPFLFWPEATIAVYRDIAANRPGRLRWLGLLLVALGTFMAFSTNDVATGFATFVFVVGLCLVAAGLFVAIAPTIPAELGVLFLDGLDPEFFRAVAIVSIAFAVFIAWYAAREFL